MGRNGCWRVNPCHGGCVAADEQNQADLTIRNTGRVSLFDTAFSDDDKVLYRVLTYR